ncbi:MAG: ATP-binding cassette domain-containing protein [Clostridia bacterium]|nr:ATP-binding cassette domain-containing protein [Clostridia bacterium]
MLELKNIHWNTPDGTPILNGLDLVIPDGKLIVVTGPNGGGKTTLAKIIAGIEKPVSGQIIYNGEDITELGVTERANKGISFAFQQPVRFKGITVRRLIELAANKKLPESDICNSLSKVGLCARDYIDREVNSTLSGGEIKRIEIATVLARHTNLSVFDEPEAGIDLWSFTNLIQVFEKIRSDMKGTMMIISHQERILKIADEIAVVANGIIKAQGPAETIMSELLNGQDMRQSCSKQEEMFR